MKRKINNKPNIINLDGTNKKNIKYIYHLADIHIKNDQSTRESYDIVFKRLYETIISYGHEDESLIVVCGDIFDNKTNIKPEAISMIKEFFYNLTNITDCVVILGNHEKPASNKEAMDVLTPIITQNFHTNKKLFLLKEKYYNYNNVLFGLTNLYDTETTKFYFETNKTKIALYHGYIHGAKLENGHEEHIVGRFNMQDFSSAEYLLLGDIHKFQYLNKEKTMAYPGSLLQLSFGEDISGHGFIRWDLQNKKSEFVEIKNDYCYLTIRVNKSHTEDHLLHKTDLPKNIRIKFIWENISRTMKNDIIEKYKQKYNIVEIREVDEIKGLSLNLTSDKLKITDQLKNISSTKSLLNNYIDQKMKYSDDIKIKLKEYIAKILENVEIKNDNIVKNLKLDTLKFNNLYVYGENNEINFKNLKKIVGLIAPNKYGKSSILEIIIQSIWGENTKGVSNNDIINYKKSEYRTEVILFINQVKYKIIRIGKNNKGIKESVDLYRYDNNEIKNISKDGKQQTDKEIYEIFGNYEDYLKTCIMTQNHPFNFIDMGQTEKKVFLNKLFRLDVFRDISKKANTIKTELTGAINTNNLELKKYNLTKIKEDSCNIENIINDITKKIGEHNIYLESIKNDLIIDNHKCAEINDAINNHTNLQIVYDELSEHKNKYQNIIKKLDNLNEQKEKINNELEYLKESIRYYETIKMEEINIFQKEKHRLKRFMSTLKNKKINCFQYNFSMDDLTNKKSKLEEKINVINKQINSKKEKMHYFKKKIILCEEITFDNIDKYNEHLILEKGVQTKYENTMKSITEYTSILNKLKDHKYNKNCEICMNNEITKQKTSIENILNEMSQQRTILNNQLNDIKKYLEDNTIKYNEYNSYIQNSNNNNNCTNNIAELEKELILCQKEEYLIKKEIDMIEHQITEYLSNNKNMNYNNDIDIELVNAKNDIYYIENIISKTRTEYNNLKKKYEKYISSLHEINLKINEQTKNQIELENVIEKMEIKYKKQQDIENKYRQLIIFKNRIEENNLLLSKCQTEISNYYEKKDELQIHLNKLIQFKQNYKILTEKIKNDEKEKDIYVKIVEIFNKGGINDEILKEMIIPALEVTVNNILSCTENYNIRIEYDDKQTFKIYKDDNIVKNNLLLNSGHERGIDNIVFRLAFCFINNYIKTNFFIIDEGFKHSDEEHKDNLKSLFEYIRTTFDWCLVTTHDDYVKNNFDSQINIEKINSTSLIKA